MHPLNSRRYAFEAHSPRGVPVQSEPRDSASWIAQEPDHADILAHERVLEDGMQRRGFNDKVRITHMTTESMLH